MTMTVEEFDDMWDRRRELEHRVAAEDRIAPARGVLFGLCLGAFVCVVLTLLLWALIAS